MSVFSPQSRSQVSVDDQGNVRLLPQDDFEKTEQLGKESSDFVASTSSNAPPIGRTPLSFGEANSRLELYPLSNPVLRL
jgi:hypothetical protein